MLKVSFLEFIIRGIPEGLLFFMAVHAFSKKIIQRNRYLLSSIIYSTMVYLIRFLPIQNSVDNILNLIVLITLTVIIIKVDIIQSIKAGIIAMLLMFASEALNIFFIQYIMKRDLNEIFNHPILKILSTSPSLLIFGCVIVAFYIRLLKSREMKNN